MVSKVNLKNQGQWVEADLSITLRLDSATMHLLRNLVSYLRHSNTSLVTRLDQIARSQTNNTPSELVEPIWRGSLSKTSGNMVIPIFLGRVDISQTKGSKPMEGHTQWPPDYLMISWHLKKVRNCQDQASINTPRSLERISSNLRLELRVNTHSVRRMIDLACQLKKWLLQLQMYIALKITWIKISIVLSLKLSKLPLAKISLA